MAIEGFSKRYAEAFADGNYTLADYLADQAFAMSEMTDQQFLDKYTDQSRRREHDSF